MPLVLVKRQTQADIAHLVERNLAKVEVASSSLVVRSNFLITSWLPVGPVAQLVRATGS